MKERVKHWKKIHVEVTWAVMTGNEATDGLFFYSSPLPFPASALAEYTILHFLFKRLEPLFSSFFHLVWR